MIEPMNFGANVGRPWEQVNLLSTTGDVLATCSCGCACSCDCDSYYAVRKYSGDYTNNAAAVCFPEP